MVLMPVYNGEPYLREAIESILAQSLTDFQFLIINDGSADGSRAIINSYHDQRIQLLENECHLGLVASLNRGLCLAQGDYIARMDCDDISLPGRLSKQVAFMAEHPEVGLCGGWIECFREKNQVLQVPLQHEEIVRALPRYNPVFHPTVMLRTQILKSHSLYYDPEYRHVEDYELWSRMVGVTRCANLPEVLVRHRIHPAQVGRRFAAEQRANVKKLQA